MANSYISVYIHYVFSTKQRIPYITPEIREPLWEYMGGIARKNNIKALAIGGTDDHAHLLVSIPAVISAAKAVQLIKGGSSKWIKEAVNNMNDFSWQEGYGAFSVSLSFIDKTIRYIEQQEEHHRRRSFQEEYLEFLDKHGIEYDDRYVWG